MKNTLVILAALATGVAIASTMVESSNTFGLAEATGATGWKIISVPVTGYAGEGNISIAEILQTSNLTAGDELYTLAESGIYNRYTLNETKTEWTPAKAVSIDANGDAVSTDTDSATTATIARGQAFWLNTAATTVYLMGEATTGNVGVKVVGQAVTGKWNLIGNSSMANDVKISSITGTKGDVLKLANGTCYVYGKDRGSVTCAWKRQVLDKDNNLTYESVSDDTDVIAVGQGFLFMSKAAEGTEIISEL